MTDHGARAAPRTASTSGLGATVTLDALAGRPYDLLARLRAVEPVAWVPVLDGWLVTRRDLCIEVMRDAARFTVDDPRFSTAQVVGPSMLSLDGDEHRRHRDPFATAFLRPEVAARFTDGSSEAARSLVASLAPEAGRDPPRPGRSAGGRRRRGRPRPARRRPGRGPGLVRRDRRGRGSRLGRWRDRFPARGRGECARATRFGHDRARRTASSPTRPRRSAGRGRLERRGDDVRRHRDERGHDDLALLAPADQPRQLAAVRADRSLGPNAVEESLRLEPAAGRVDRYATADVELAGADRRGDLVIVSLTAANRDPATFPDPDPFDLARPMPGRTWPSPRVPTLASGSTWPGSRRWRRSTPRSTAGPTSGSTTGPRHPPGSSSASLARCRSAGIHRPDPPRNRLPDVARPPLTADRGGPGRPSPSGASAGP